MYIGILPVKYRGQLICHPACIAIFEIVGELRLGHSRVYKPSLAFISLSVLTDLLDFLVLASRVVHLLVVLCNFILQLDLQLKNIWLGVLEDFLLDLLVQVDKSIFFSKLNELRMKSLTGKFTSFVVSLRA